MSTIERIKGRINRFERKNGGGSADVHTTIMWSTDGGVFGHTIQKWPIDRIPRAMTLTEELTYLAAEWQQNPEGLDFASYLGKIERWAPEEYLEQRRRVKDDLRLNGFSPGKADQIKTLVGSLVGRIAILNNVTGKPC